MIKCNLAVLLAERGLKMADVINDTSLSKTAVRGLYYNQSKGIQFETLETICDYLNVDPEDVIKKIKFKYDIISTSEIIDDTFKTDFKTQFKLDEKSITSIIQVSITDIVGQDIDELLDTCDTIFELDDLIIDFEIDYSEKLQRTILSQLTEIERDKLDDFFINQFLDTYHLYNCTVRSFTTNF